MSTPSPAPVTQRVRQLLAQALAHGQLPDAAGIASMLALSVRTLGRRLQEEGSSLSRLLEAVRLERAELLLADADLPLARVAELVGYSDLTTFSRAFKRVTGRTPAARRRPESPPLS